MPSARRSFPAEGGVTVVAGVHESPSVAPGGAVVLRGREAAAVAELVIAAHVIAGIRYGTLHLDMTPSKVSLRIEQCVLPVHIEGGPAPKSPEPALTLTIP